MDIKMLDINEIKMLDTNEIEEKREVLIKPEDYSYNQLRAKSDNDASGFIKKYPLVGKWYTLKFSGAGSFTICKKTVTWDFGFDSDWWAENFVLASLSGDYSNLPSIIEWDEKNHYKNNLYWFCSRVLGLEEWEMSTAKSLVLQDIDGGWKYNFISEPANTFNDDLFLHHSKIGWMNNDMGDARQ